jgi:pSer/pThr/pTyr-binding forkhead associated (FHA) protein
VTQKLAIYFLSQGHTPRVLDADQQPCHGDREGWLVGRSPTCDISFRATQNADYDKVSKNHALITATLQRDTTQGGSPVYRWEVTDLNSTNGTYLGTQPHLYRCSPGVPHLLTDRALIMFGAIAARVRVSYDIDDTQSGDDDEPPTGWNKPAKAEPPTAPESVSWADVAVIVLNGPDGVPNPLWWAFLGILSVIVLWIWRN